MKLTSRATAWLATLERETPVATAIVEQRIRDAGGTPHKVWLDFHDNYAGYIERLGSDLAIWGLSRDADFDPPPQWIPAGSVRLIPGDTRLPEGIACAEAHLVHTYELLSNGHYMGVGGPAESFERVLERHGLMLELSSRGPVERTKIGRGLDKQEHQDLIEEMQAGLIPEASDKHAELYLEPTRLLKVGRITNYLVLYEVVPP